MLKVVHDPPSNSTCGKILDPFPVTTFERPNVSTPIVWRGKDKPESASVLKVVCGAADGRKWKNWDAGGGGGHRSAAFGGLVPGRRKNITEQISRDPM